MDNVKEIRISECGNGLPSIGEIVSDWCDEQNEQRYWRLGKPTSSIQTDRPVQGNYQDFSAEEINFAAACEAHGIDPDMDQEEAIDAMEFRSLRIAAVTE